MYSFKFKNKILLILIVKIVYAEVLSSTQVTVYTDVTWTGNRIAVSLFRMRKVKLNFMVEYHF